LVDEHDQGYEGFPTELGTWLPAPRRPHVSEMLPPRVAPPRDGGLSYRAGGRRPHIGLATPPPLVRLPRLVRRPPATRALLLAAMLGPAAVATALVLVPGVPPALRAAALAALLAGFAAAAERVSYRRRDAALLLVPIANVFLFVQVCWRLTALPDRPWPRRIDELAGPRVRPGYVDGADPWDSSRSSRP
jgi:hypothetical protein